MCEKCGISFSAFNSNNDDDLLTLLNALLDEVMAEPGPISSYMEERGLTPEFELSGEFMDKPWIVKVTEIPLEDIAEELRGKGSQWWAMDGYYDGKLVRSSEGAPPEPVTAKEAAEVYAEYHFDYVIPA